jgi:hypothetical protein
MRYFIAFLIVGSLWIATASAQVLTDSIAPYRSVFGLHQWSVVAGGFLITNEAEVLSGAAYYGGNPTWAARLGVNYVHSFKNNFAIETGFHVGGFPQAYGIALRQENFPQLSAYFNEFYSEYTVTVEIPLRLVYRQNIGQNFLLQSKVGGSLRLFPINQLTIDYLSPGNPDSYVFSIVYGSPSPVHICGQLGVGLSYIFRNLNMVSINLLYNYSPQTVMEGFVRAVPDSPQESRGRFYTRGSYFGIELGYTFTNKRLRK